jgi:predicted secreted protein
MASKKLGSDYMVWVESAVPGTYNVILGQGNSTINRSSSNIDMTSKDDGDYGTGAPGPRALSVDLDILPKLPDANGYTRLETLANASPRAPFNIQIRKGGLTGAPADAVFQCSVYGNLDTTSLGQGAAVSTKTTFTAAEAPTIDTLA